MDETLDLEALWKASPDGPPADVPPALWPTIESGEGVLGAFRSPAGEIVVICAVPQPLAGMVAAGAVLVSLADNDGDPGIALTFTTPQGPSHPLGMRFSLSRPDQRVFWSEILVQGGLWVSYIDVGEAVLLERRHLDLRRVAAQLWAAIEAAEAAHPGA